MQSRVTPELREQAAHFNLRFCCTDCVYFAESESTCALGYPNEEHLLPEGFKEEHVTFCKEFELGS